MDGIYIAHDVLMMISFAFGITMKMRHNREFERTHTQDTGCHLYFHWEKMQRARIKCKNNVFFEVIFFLLRLFYYLRFKYDSVHNLLRQGFDLMTWSSSFDKKTNYSLLFGKKCLFSSNFCIEVICISIAVPCSL